MDGIWLEDGTFQAAPGARAKLKGKGKKGKGKGEPPSKRQKVDDGQGDSGEDDEFDFEGEWKDRQVCLVNLKAASLNGVYGSVKEHLGVEELIIDGKKKRIRRFLVALEDCKGEKSLKFENLFKVITGAVVKLRGLDTMALNDSIAECGRLEVETMRYDVTLSDGRHIKVKPSNVELVARYETVKVGGSKEHMEWFKNSSSLSDRIEVIEFYEYPLPMVLPAAALEDYAKKYPKAVVIGKSNAANPKGAQQLAREVMTISRVPASSRIVFASMPRENKDRACVAPALADMRHDELLRLGKFGGWVAKRCAPRSVYFLLPGVAAKGTGTVLNSATCAWPLYVGLCTDVVAVMSERWRKSPWTRLDALLAVWARRPLYLLPEKYAPPIELPGATTAAADADLDAVESARTTLLSFHPEEPLTIDRPCHGLSSPPALLAELEARAAEMEAVSGAAKVKCPSLAVRKLG